MNIEITSRLSGNTYEKWRRLLEGAGLVVEGEVERTVLLYDGDELVAAGSRDGCVLKLIAVADSHRGEDITAAILTELRRDAFSEGHSHLFLYTKPQNRYMFESLFFYTVAQTQSVLVMENKKDGISKFLSELPAADGGAVNGAIVMNCNPFTRGHRALIERAASECERLYVFVLSEDKSEFSFEERMEMVKLGTSDLENVTVLSTGHYLISAATFPTYFIKNRDAVDFAASEVDVKIFASYFAPRLAITRRYVGTEPASRLTAEYNEMLKGMLPSFGIEVREIERACVDGAPISASEVRRFIRLGDVDAVSRLVPRTTLDYLIAKGRV